MLKPYDLGLKTRQLMFFRMMVECKMQKVSKWLQRSISGSGSEIVYTDSKGTKRTGATGKYSIIINKYPTSAQNNGYVKIARRYLSQNVTLPAIISIIIKMRIVIRINKCIFKKGFLQNSQKITIITHT